MKILKKASTLLLPATMVFGYIFVSNRKNKYIAAKNLTAYTSTSGTKKAFTIKKGSKAYIYALYQNGSKRYIKVKNSSGKYGYVKVGSSMLFTEKSCLWWR